MKCPKCSYHSFDHLNDCKKCGTDLTAHKAKFNLRGFYAPGQTESTMPATAETAETETIVEDSAAGPGSDNVDFGFDFLDEDDSASSSKAGIDDNQGVNIDQPFDVGSEAVPADSGSSKVDKDSGFDF